MLFYILLAVFIIVCLLLCLLVLIQSDKGGGISGAVGGLSGANNFLGTQDTANVLTKGTYAFGIAFLVLCLGMTLVQRGGGGASRLPGFVEQSATVTSRPASSGSSGFDNTGVGDVPLVGSEASPGPVIEGSIIEGGVEKKLVDGELVPVEGGSE